MFSKSIRPNVISDASNLYSQMNAAATPNNLYSVQDRNVSASSKFPVQLGTADPEDLRMNLRQQVVDGKGNVPGYGMAVADDQVFSYIERKKEAEIEADYRSWIMAQADFSDPARAEFWNKVAPWITDLKLQEIEENANLQKRLATIKVKGPTNEEDFKTLYFIQNGVIRMPSQPLHLMDQDTVRYAGKDTLDFRRGLFNPLATRPPPKGMAPKQTIIPDKWGNSLPGGNNADANVPWIPSGWSLKKDGKVVSNSPMELFQRPVANGAPQALI